MSSRPPGPPPELVGFRFLDVLGTGGFADVFKYEHLARPVAVKVLLTPLGTNNQQVFEAEAHTMAKLSGHPNVVSIYDAGRTPAGDAYLVMEYCPPPHLGVQIRQQERPFAVSKVLEIGIKIAGAVESAHRLGILHRDIKPANILTKAVGWPALTDFGIATSIQGGSVVEGVSVPWAPPEQLVIDARVDRSGDVYSLAATMWTMLSGRSPFELVGRNDTRALIKRIQEDPLPAIGRADVPPSLERVLGIAMAKSPGQRYQSAQEFARALQAVEGELHLPTTPFDIVADRSEVSPAEESDAAVRISPPLTPASDERSSTHGPAISGSRPGKGRPSQSPQPTPAIRPIVDPRPVPVPPAVHSAVPSGHAFVGLPDRDPTLEDTHRAPVAEPVVTPEPDTARPPRPRPDAKVVLAGAIAAMVLLAVIGWVIWGPDQAGTSAANHDRSPAPTAQDPVGYSPPAVDRDRLHLRLHDKTVVATWTNPDPLPGDSYEYRLWTPAQDENLTSTTAPTATLSRQQGQTCIEVLLVRSHGRPRNEGTVKCIGS